jgi:hypothetical protein
VGHLIETVRTGTGGSQRALGIPFFEYLIKQPSAGLLFDRTMAGEGPFRHRPAVEAYDFGQFKTVVDIGGGNAALMAEIQKAYPQPTGIVLDLPRAADAAQHTIADAGLSDRCRFVGGDAFETVLAGGEAYVLSNFLVLWQDAQAIMPLRNCRKAIAENGKVLLIEWVMPAGSEPREGFPLLGYGSKRPAHAQHIWQRRRSGANQIRVPGFPLCSWVRVDRRSSDPRLRQCDRSQTGVTAEQFDCVIPGD